MKLNEYIDATVLNVDATQGDIETLCQSAMELNLKAICVNPSYIEFAKNLLGNSSVKIATVVSFPMGVGATHIKENEILFAKQKGADEIDFVINRSLLANEQYSELYHETATLIDLCREENLVSKWIVESPILTENQLNKVVEIANSLLPDFVKTSTGIYSKATLATVDYLYNHLNPQIQIKASGGIKSQKEALAMIEMGAERIGTSSYREIIEGV